jgi:hypothetical protein
MAEVFEISGTCPVAILYVETNMLLSVATGRDPEANELLVNPPHRVRLAVPQICCMEALSVLDEERRRRKRFTNTIQEQVVQLKRDLTSVHARTLQSHLEQALVANERLISEIATRLFDAFDQIAQVADLIALSPESLTGSRRNVLIPDLTDNLILHGILEHARANPADVKVLLSGNRKDFGTDSVRDALQAAGINKYVPEAKQFLGWYRSQPAP